MNEAETRAELIDPQLKAAGWGDIEGSRIRREFPIKKGKKIGFGKRETPTFADYVLEYRNQKLAVIEAKKRDLEVTEGLAQAKRDAARLQTPFTFSTNGRGIYRVDMRSGEEGLIENYPNPEELWNYAFKDLNEKEKSWNEKFSEVDYDTKNGNWEPRYYQHNAIENTLSAIASGRDRILLTLATGTGKTAIASQVCLKLFNSRWNLTDWRRDDHNQPLRKRRPKILFLADRNTLADQAFNEFDSFTDSQRARISPDEIKKRGSVPKNASIFFTIFQTFMTKVKEDDEEVVIENQFNFGQYPPDFFDLIIIDECHRGGANDESSWRGIMEYFSAAVQIGLTATPKRKENADTYSYFGEPVFIYSLKDGINDGFLSPYKVKKIETTLDEYVFSDEDKIIQGEIEKDKKYTEAEFNKDIEIIPRERYRVETFMSLINQRDKTLVFCNQTPHPLTIRDLINQCKDSRDPDYCVRVTSADGKLGDTHLKTFQDNERTVPTILTTSRKLSTGINARNIRNIVLMREIRDIIEFKQIIGRGTRDYEDKDFFTIYDFVGASKHFYDPDWDGEPEPESPKPSPPPIAPYPPFVPDPEPPESPPKKKIKVELSDGNVRTIEHTVQTIFVDTEGKPLTAEEFVKQLYGCLPTFFKNEDELVELWRNPATRKNLMKELAEKGYTVEQLLELGRMVDAENSDILDVLIYIAYALNPISREERVKYFQENSLQTYSDKTQEFLTFILGEYQKNGVKELGNEKLQTLLEMKYKTVNDGLAQLGSAKAIRTLFVDFQKQLYQPRVI